MWLCRVSGQVYFTPLNLGWLYDLLWLVEKDRSDSFSCKPRLQSTLHIPLCLSDSCLCHVSKAKLTCWTMKGLMKQSQVSLIVPAKAIDPRKPSQEQQAMKAWMALLSLNEAWRTLRLLQRIVSNNKWVWFLATGLWVGYCIALLWQ
jgi:hypothetical protein